ncbi:MAG: hypothetical protein IPG01_10580 [Chitinophagaceae bacterium]|nr:hypothetical protein [Chitinophagaceae bacterium]
MNIVKGKILVKETLVGIPNLLVVLYDIDPRTLKYISESFKDERVAAQPLNINYYWARINGDRIGSVVTNERGEFELSYENSEFIIEQKEFRPDLILFVLPPEEELPSSLTPNLSNIDLTHGPLPLPEEISPPKILYISKSIRANAGKIESYVIKISEKKLKEFDIEVRKVQDNIEEKKVSIQNSITDAYILGNAIKNTLNLATKEKLLASKEVKKRAKGLIHSLSLSSVNSQVRNDPTYLNPTDNLISNHGKVMVRTLSKLKERSKIENKRPSLIISNSTGNSDTTSIDPSRITQFLIDNPRGPTIERKAKRPNNIQSKAAQNFISQIVNKTSNSNLSNA